MEHVWFRHLASALVFAATLAGYWVYLRSARLTARVKLDAARLNALRRPGKARWAAASTIIYWGLMASFAIEIATGAMLFTGADRITLTVHLWTMWACLAFIGLHVACHARIGGVSQLTRIVRPAALIVAPDPPDLAELLAEQLRLREQAAHRPPPVTKPAASRDRTLNAHPAATALAAATAFSIAAVGLESTTRPGLTIPEIPAGHAPVLDGDLSDPVWMKAQPVTIVTSQGGDFGGTGQSVVEVRAVHDGTFVYFAFVWSDPTRSLKHQPLIKTADGWRLAPNAGREGEAFHDDKFSVLLSNGALPLIGAAIHLSATPRRDRPASATGRGLHYTTDGSIADVWVWRASHGGLNGHIDNAHFGAAVEPTAEQANGTARYTGGFALDPGPPAYRPNAETQRMADGESRLVPYRLPRDPAATARALGRLSPSAGLSDADGSRWWTGESETIPYSKAADDKIPVGTVIPGVFMNQPVEAAQTSIRGVARWAAGRWTLELGRRLHTGSAADVPIKTGTLMWVAAFDHAESRHTRHLRPLRLEVK